MNLNKNNILGEMASYVSIIAFISFFTYIVYLYTKA